MLVILGSLEYSTIPNTLVFWVLMTVGY
jgi:hypothetical protein